MNDFYINPLITPTRKAACKHFGVDSLEGLKDKEDEVLSFMEKWEENNPTNQPDIQPIVCCGMTVENGVCMRCQTNYNKEI